MSQEPSDQASRKDKTAAWISARPLMSIAGTATLAFFLGIGAGASGSSDQAMVDTELASSSVELVENELADSQSQLEDAENEVDELRDENSDLQDALSAKAKTLRKIRSSLSATRTKLSKARAQASAAVAAVQPAAEPDTTGGGGGDCDSNYSGTCVPVVSYDLNCDDIGGSVRVVGSDPHGFDGDGDGYGCE